MFLLHLSHYLFKAGVPAALQLPREHTLQDAWAAPQRRPHAARA